jgi:cytidylate kinase
MAVITISRQAGSGGNAIAALVCKTLNYRYFDKNMLAQVASEETQSEVDFLKFTEEDFVKGSRLTNRLLTALGQPTPAVAQIRTWGEDKQGKRVQTVTQLDESRAITLVQNAINYVADQGNVVIMGRGAQAILDRRPGVLHVRITAPWEDRVQRLKQQNDLRGENARREAEIILMREDDAGADYLRRFYDAKIDDPLLYHLVLNTGKLSVETAARLITDAVQALSAAA